MTPSLEETVYLDFITSSSTGAAADADSTPAAEVFEDATDTAILTPTVTKRTGKTGNYRVPVACTAANGFEAGKSYNAIASATIGGVAAKCKIGTFQVRAKDTDDVLSAQLADGVAHGGTTATLQLGSSSSTPALLVRNTRLAGSPAVKFEATGTGGLGLDLEGGGGGLYATATSSGAGVTAQGAGSGAGFIMGGGATGAGWSIIGGATSGNAIDMTLTSGNYLPTAAWSELWTNPAARTVTGGTIGTYTGNTPQTGDAFALIGTAGAGLTSLATAAAVAALPTAAQNADKLLGRNLAGGSDGGRTVKDALRPARNKVAFDVPGAGQFTVYAEDDSTPAWVGTYARSATADNPLATLDPA